MANSLKIKANLDKTEKMASSHGEEDEYLQASEELRLTSPGEAIAFCLNVTQAVILYLLLLAALSD